MTQRISWTLLILTAMLLALAVIPLAASMTGRERIAYRDSQRAATRVIAAVAEEHLSDHRSADPCVRSCRPQHGPVTASRCTTRPRAW